MKINLNTVLGIGGCVVGLVGIGYAMGSHKKLGDICKKVGVAIDDLSGRTNVDIPESMVRQAMNKAVDSEMHKVVKSASSKVVNDMNREIRTQVSAAVLSKTDSIGGEVTDRIAREVSKINMDVLSSQVAEKAQAAVLEKFDGNLDDILNKFNKDLNNVSKIYNSIAQSMSSNNANNVAKTITLGM